MNLYEKLEERVKKYWEEHPDKAREADEFMKAHPELFQFEPTVTIDDDMIQHVGYDDEQCGREK